MNQTKYYTGEGLNNLPANETIVPDKEMTKTSVRLWRRRPNA